MATACVPQLVRAFIERGPVVNTSYNLNIIAEFGFLFLFFSTNISHPKRKTIFLACGITGTVINIAYLIFWGISSRFLSELVCINNLVYTAWVFLTMLDLYEYDDIIVDKKLPLFWFLIGLFFYFCCTVLIFGLWDFIRSNENTGLRNLWIVHDIFNIVMYLFITKGFLLTVSKTRHANIA